MSHKVYKISGVPVMFPGKPYPSQFSMMDRIIKGIERRQHCLLESPTGSGKSLALLCSSLAWLMEEKAKKDEEDQDEIEKATCVCACHVTGSKPESDSTAISPKLSTESDTDKGICIKDDDDEDVFKKDALNFNTKSSDKKNSKKHISIEYELEGIASTHKSESHECKQCSCTSNEDQTTVKRRIPKIFFCTRTHKQVAQIVRELKKTEYRDINMTILGSREHTCIHHVVSKSKSKDDGCRELLAGPGCSLENKVHRYKSCSVVKSQGLSSAWDLEDLVKFGKTKKVCPYFLSRGLKDEADLVICPYNYLVDPLIRDALPVSLKGQVVILDEAHNIEDSAREAASQTIPQETVGAAIKDIDELMKSHNLAEYSRLIYVLTQLDSFIDENKNSLDQKDFNQAYKIWNGFHIVAQLEAMGLGPGHFRDLKKAFNQIKMDTEERREESKRTGQPLEEMKQGTLNVFAQLFLVMDFMYREDLKYVDDYRATLVHSISYVPRHTENQWLNSRNKNGGRKMMQVDAVNLNFWSMNPAVTFSDFVDTRSVILTSGTLSPMTSFQSELGLDFKIQLEANHIIKDSQVWVGSLGQGPNGTSLMAVYRNLESLTFQDELGQVVLQVCKTVPHGVLCFLPSYKVLDKLYTRWESTGLLDKVGERKQVFREPRSSGKEDFEEQITSYYRAVESTNDPDDTIDGAIMFAVCRGKISEGMDFADDFARAVISVGIPYPNFKDLQVELKRKYNDSHRQDRGLLSGSDWYDIQGFRALNQALGRCIRHRNDWGALIIIDERFVKSTPKYAKGLSKWVRNKLCTHDNYRQGMNSLKEFITRCEEEEKERKLTASASPTPETPKPSCLDTSVDTTGRYSIGLDTKDNDGKCQQVKTETPKKELPKSRQFSIFNMTKPRPNVYSKQTKFPQLSSISSPSVKNIPPSTAPSTIITSNQLPMAVVHPSFIVPLKPLVPISNVLNQPINVIALGHSTTAPQQYGHNSLAPHQPGVYAFPNNNTIGATSGMDTKPFSSLTTQKQIPDPVPYTRNIALKIVTAVAPLGTRMQVFDIDPSLHDIFGGNLNLPVSTTERLVYVVEPLQTPGGNPLARLMRMPKEAKEKLANAGEQRKEGWSISVVENPNAISSNPPRQPVNSMGQQSEKSPSSNTSLRMADRNGSKSECQNELSTNTSRSCVQLKENIESSPPNIRICNNSGFNDPKNYIVTEGAQDSLEEEPNSSCSLFDSPDQPTANESPSVISHSSHSESGRNSPSTDSNTTGSNKKNPLLKFLQTKGTKHSSNSASKSEKNRDIPVDGSSSSSKISPDLFGSKEDPSTEDLDCFKPTKTRKPLFKMSDKRSVSNNTTIDDQQDSFSLKSSKSDTNCSESVVKSNTNNVRRSTSKSLQSSPVVCAGKEGEEDEEVGETETALKVKRKCGRKRRSLSLRAPDEKNKKTKSDLDDSAKEENDGEVSKTFGCLRCGGKFFDGKIVSAMDFTREKTPPFLIGSSRVEDGDAAISKADCFFFQTNPGRAGLTDLAPGQKEPHNKIVEEEDICIQYLYCSQCVSSNSKTNHLAVRPLGARILMACVAGTRFAKGQLWLFGHSLIN